jgi:hypothetical protein
MTPNEVITEVRRLIQDTRTPFRYSDTVLLGFVNQTIKRMVILRPDLFTIITDVPTVANTVIQSLPSDSVRLVEIFSVTNGGAVIEVSREVIDQTTPDWTGTPPDVPVNFMRHPRNPNQFFVYPRPRNGVQLVAEYVQSPGNYDLNDTVDLPDAYFSVLVDGTVFLAESVDNEHVNSGRAKLFQESFVQQLGVALQSRALTDTESGSGGPAQREN